MEHVALMEKWIRAYRVLVGKPEGRRPHGRYKHGWEENIIIHLQEGGWDGGGGMEWIGLAEDRDR